MYYCFYIVCTGSDRPALRDLHHHMVRQAAHKWSDLGVELLDDDQIRMLDMIAADHPHDADCCSAVLKRWLGTTPDASWYQLIRALRSPFVQLDSLADQLEEKLDIKCKIYSNITTNCTL